MLRLNFSNRKPRGLGVHLVHNVAEIDELKLPNSTAYPLDKTKPIAQRYITDVLTVAVLW